MSMLRSYLALAMFGMGSLVVQASPVLDQQHNFSSAVAQSTNGNVTELGQTFTVGIAGTLDHIDVLMFRLSGIFDPTGDPTLHLYNTTAGFPSGAPLATATVAEAMVPLNAAGFVTFDISGAAVPVSVGDVLAFGISSTSLVGPYFLLSDTDLGQPSDYSAGRAVSRIISPVGPWTAFTPSLDFGFKTFVVVPEMNSVCLLMIGTAALAARRALRRKRA